MGKKLKNNDCNALLSIEVVTLFALGVRASQECVPHLVDNETLRLLLSTLTTPEWLREVRDSESILHNTFRDLQDAGCDPVHLEPLREALSETRWWKHGKSVFDLYEEWITEFEKHGFISPSQRIRAAAKNIEEGFALPYKQLFWYGLYDLTGVMGELVLATCKQVPGTLYFPAFDAEAALTQDGPDRYLKETYSEYIVPARTESRHLSLDSIEPQLEAFNASGESAELEEVARRISSWASEQEGAPDWSKVAIIARELSAYMQMAHPVFKRFGIPIATARPVSATHYVHCHGLLAVVEIARNGLSRNALMTALGTAPNAGGFGPDLGRLDQQLQEQVLFEIEHWQTLNSALGKAEQTLVDEPHAQTLRPILSTCHNTLIDWPITAEIGTHLLRLKQLMNALCGTNADDMLQSIQDALRQTPGLIKKTPFLAAVTRIIHGWAAPEDKGRGVQLLDIMAARGMVFERVFLIGLNRRRWPRSIREDPIMPDQIRRRLRDLGLNAIPVKERGHAEEALLFRLATQSALSHLTVSYLRSDPKGKALVSSPFLDRLEKNGHPIEATPIARRKLDALAPLIADKALSKLPPADLAYYCAVRGRFDALPGLAVLHQHNDGSRFLDAGIHAASERDRLGELGPHDGILSPGWRRSNLDSHLFPTSAQKLVSCPWQYFAEKILRLNAPDEAGPLPTFDHRVFGSLIHELHDMLVKWLKTVPKLNDSAVWDEAAQRCQKEIALLTSSNPYNLVMRDKLALYAKALVNLLKTRYGGSGPLAPGDSEDLMFGEINFDNGSQLKIGAKVDRIDLQPGTLTELRMSDLKTGTAPDDKSFIKKTSTGRLLQAPFYHWLAKTPLDWSGYEYLIPGESMQEHGLTAENWALWEAPLRSFMEDLSAMLDQGIFVFKDDKWTCQYCNVAETCLRHHYAAKQRRDSVLESPDDDPPTNNNLIRRFFERAATGVTPEEPSE
ncbi:MAG TPA: PD-(D/E)XK nuclease family protein [Myxococcales bacterium]|nr:PD-(D/E)XK nuclease family protein [Myxococcales bacterium]